MGLNTIEIKSYLNEMFENATEKFVVREVDEDDRVVRTRLVQTEEAAQLVKQEWQKR